MRRGSAELYLYFDDSGVLCRRETDKFFVYAGYIFTTKEEKDAALRSYRSAERELRKNPRLSFERRPELKACYLKGSHKRFLNGAMSPYHAIACVVETAKVHTEILSDRKAIHRFKDYCLKRIVKEALVRMAALGEVDPRRRTMLRLYVDNQATTSDGYYTLSEGIREELWHGVKNFDYGIFYPPVFRAEVGVTTTYCDSARNPLVRACDLLANSLYTKYNFSPAQGVHHRRVMTMILP